MRQLALKIYGRVQGVFFRTETESFARSLGLVGYVKNVPDGTVEIIAEGSEESLTKLKKWCINGSLHAHVDRVEDEWSEVGHTSFECFKTIY